MIVIGYFFWITLGLIAATWIFAIVTRSVEIISYRIVGRWDDFFNCNLYNLYQHRRYLYWKGLIVQEKWICLQSRCFIESPKEWSDRYKATIASRG